MCWHKWSKWEQYTFHGIQTMVAGRKTEIPFMEKRQKRNCLKCNKQQDERID